MNEPGPPEPDPEDEYTCRACQRRKHALCTDPECTCCLGNED